MKKIFCALFLALVCFGHVWANTDSHYYAQLKAEVSSECSGRGLVYAGTSETAGTYGSSSESDKVDAKNNSNGVEKTFYAFAKVTDDKHMFLGWSDKATGATEYTSNDSGKGYKTYKVKTSTSSGGTSTKTCYAYFAEKYYFSAKAGIDAAGNGTGKVCVKIGSTSPSEGEYIAGDAYATYSEFAPTHNVKSLTKTVTFYAKPDNGMNLAGWYNATGTEKQVSGGNITLNGNNLVYSYASTNTDDTAEPVVFIARFKDPSKKYNPFIELTGLDGQNEITLMIEESQGVSFVNVDASLTNELASPSIVTISRIDEGTDPVITYNSASKQIVANRVGKATISFHHAATDDYNEGNFTFTVNVEKYEPTIKWLSTALFENNVYSWNQLISTPSTGAWSIVSDNTDVFPSLSPTSTTSATAHTGTANLTFSQEADYKYNAVSSMSIQVKCYNKDDLATFSVNGTNYYFLDEAITAANSLSSNKNIVVASDGIVVPGNYTIPSGVTLLVPMDANNEIKTTMPDVWSMHSDRNGTWGKNLSAGTNKDESSVYRKLTMANGATINVNGSICLNADRWVLNDAGYYGKQVPGMISGDFRLDRGYGMIDMQQGSSIVLNSGANLYCWGRIRGEGKITAKSGSKVYESLVYTDHRELEAYGILAAKSNSFIFNQYFIQDIQVSITYESGAQCVLATAFFHYSTSAPATGSFNLIGTNDSKSLFELPKGSTITKTYNVREDRLEFDLNNGANISQLQFNLDGTKYSTAKNLFTVTHNWSINVKTGTTTIKQSLHFAPGAELNIASNATVVADMDLYFYDARDWGTFASKKKIIPLFLPKYEIDNNSYEGITLLTYTGNTGNTYKALRNENNMSNAVLKVNGTLTMNGGLYTTYTTSGDNHVANICSDGNGKVNLNSGKGSATTIQALYGAGRGGESNGKGLLTFNASNGDLYNSSFDGVDPQVTTVNIQPALLLNKDNSYISTSSAVSGSKYQYSKAMGKWGKVSNVKFIVDGVEQSYFTKSYIEGETITAPTPTKDGYTLSWNNNYTGTMPGSDVTYTAQWTPINYTITFNSNGGSDVASITQGYETALNVTNPTREGYTFACWNPTLPEKMPLNGGSYTAQWNINKYTIVFNANGGSEVASMTQDYMSEVSAPANPTRTGYTFAGWNPGVPPTMPLNGETCVAQWIKEETEIDVTAEETITVSENTNAENVVVEDKGSLVIQENTQITTTTLSLSATPSDVSIDDEYAGTSSQIKGKGDITVQNAYIDINMDASGTLNGSNYYAFAVPFNVKVDGGVQKNIKGTLSPAVLDKDFRAYTYNGVNRAQNGKGSNWTMVDKDGMFQPGVFYLVEFADGSCNTFRFTKAEGDENILNNAANIDVTKYTGSADSTNWGWNGIANNALENATFTLLNSEDKAQVFNPAKKIFETVPLSTTFSIATPLTVQTGTTGDVINSAASNSSSTPVRMLAQSNEKTFGEYTIRIKAEGAAKTADQMFISASEDAESSYMIGKDLVKMFMGNAAVAQLWVNDYGKKLSVNQAVLTDNVATASLTLYAPQAGNYAVYLKDIPKDATIYLLNDGLIVAELNEGAYTVALAKGENTQYGIRISAKTIPGVVTSVDEALVGNSAVRKVLLNGNVYIIRDGKMFNALGQQL